MAQRTHAEVLAETLLNPPHDDVDLELPNVAYLGELDDDLEAIDTTCSSTVTNVPSLDSDLGTEPPFEIGPQLQGIHGYLRQKNALQKAAEDAKESGAEECKWIVIDGKDKQHGPMNSHDFIDTIRGNPSITVTSRVASSTLIAWLPLNKVPDLGGIAEAMRPQWIVKIADGKKVGLLSQLSLERGVMTGVFTPSTEARSKTVRVWTPIEQILQELEGNWVIPGTPLVMAVDRNTLEMSTTRDSSYSTTYGMGSLYSGVIGDYNDRFQHILRSSTYSRQSSLGLSSLMSVDIRNYINRSQNNTKPRTSVDEAPRDSQDGTSPKSGNDVPQKSKSKKDSQSGV